MTGPMPTFSVKNFERFQHYKDRSPPWIKLYNELLDDYEFGRLPDASKFHLVAIWLLASRSENKIPFDPAWVSRRINAVAAVDLRLLAERGFIVVDQELQSAEHVASTLQAECLSREEGQDQQRRTNNTGENSKSAEAEKPTKTVKPTKASAKTGVPEDLRLQGLRDIFLTEADKRGVPRGTDEFEQFIDHHRKNGSTFADWEAAGRTWLRNALKFASGPRNQRGPPRERHRNGFIAVLEDQFREQHHESDPDIIDVTPNPQR